LSIFDRIKNNNQIKLSDKVIVNDMLMGMKGMSAAYLGATLESATPEVRRLYSEYLTQCVLGHEALTGLAVKKGWYQPYQNPEEQVSIAYKDSNWVLNTQA
jgi:spore coat protein CotF